MDRKAAATWLALAIGALGAVACGGAPTDQKGNQGNLEAPGAASTVPAPGKPPEPLLTAGDIKLEVKILDKECFGSAGCNVEYRVQAGWPKEAVREGETFEVTYEITGPEEGPQVGTFTINDDGTMLIEKEFASTPRSSTKLKPKVKDLERNL